MTAVAPSPPSAPLQRARGHARVGFVQRQINGAMATRLGDLFQDGACKVRLPRVHDDGGPVAVLINTAGGITGGDELLYEATWGAGTRATLTSQAAERIYRRSHGVGRIVNRLTIGAGAVAHWLPQETIIFDRAALGRRLDIDMATDASLIAVEAIVLGRTAMGEEVRDIRLDDQWRLRRGGRLVYADALRLDGDSFTVLQGGATGGGARAFASLLVAEAAAADRLDAVRDLIAARLAAGGGEGGASAFDGLLSIRLMTQDGRALRAIVEPLVEHLTGQALPRAWSV